MICPRCSSENVFTGMNKYFCETCDNVFLIHPVEEKKEIESFNGMTYRTTIHSVHTGSRNLGTEERLESYVSYDDVVKKGIELCRKYRTNYFTIEQVKRGTWYIKGFNGKYTMTQIKQILEFNKQMNPPLYPGKCWFIEF